MTMCIPRMLITLLLSIYLVNRKLTFNPLEASSITVPVLFEALVDKAGVSLLLLFLALLSLVVFSGIFFVVNDQ